MITDPTIEVHGANYSWVNDATDILAHWLASSQVLTFTAATCADHLRDTGHPPASTPSALGAVLRQLGRKGWIARTGEYVPSPQPQQRGRPIAVWWVRRRPTVEEL